MGAMKRGTMLMEFVLTMPILFMLIMLVLQFAQIMVVRQFVAYAAFCSTRSMLCSNPSEWGNNDNRSNCARQAARRALAWVNIFGDPDTANLRSWDEGSAEHGSGDFADISDASTETYTETMYGSQGTHDVIVPGWGQVPESNSIDKRLEVQVDGSDPETGIQYGAPPGRYYAASKVTYKFPLLIPVAGQMIGFLSKSPADESLYVKSNDMMPGWTGETGELLDDVPYITLTETCVLPLPYSTANLPQSAFDYFTYD